MSTEFTAPLVPDSGIALMPEHTGSLGEGLWELLQNILSELHPNLSEAAGVCLGILAVVLLVSIVKLIPGAGERTAELVGTVGISALLLQSSNSLIRLGTATIEEISQYGKLLLGVMTSAMAAQGGFTASTALYAGTMVFDTLLCTLINRLLIPGIYIFLTLNIANAAIGEDLLKKLADMVKGISVWVLKSILYVFTGYMGITGVVSGATDAAALKAAKLTISGVVPVVGGILSDASEAVLVSAGVLRGAAGIYGIVAMAAVLAGPFLRIGCHYLLLKLTGAICGVFGSRQCTGLVSGFSGAMGLLLAMTGSVSVLQLISVVCFLRGVG